jgi:GAF domain-containing protein
VTSYTQDPIRLLIVNDDKSDLEYYRSAIQRNCGAKLDVQVFGPEEAGSQQVARSLLAALLNPVEKATRRFGIDVLFVDYRMADLNGLAFVQLLKKHAQTPETRALQRIPVVLMTKFQSSLLEELEKGVDNGIAGHVFTDRELFWLDVEATARRVFQDSQRERWAEALMEISSGLPSVSNRAALYDLIVRSVDQKCPDVKLFMREYDSDNTVAVLVATSSSVPPEARQRLHKVDLIRVPMLAGALQGQVRVCNSAEEIAPSSLSREDRELRQMLQFHRGMSFPLIDGEKNLVGTISMYRRAIDPPFTALEQHYADLVSRQIAETWSARKERQQGLAYSRFLDVFTRCEDENLVFKELVAHLHEAINGRARAGSLTKTTFKVLTPGSANLVCNAALGHHLGVFRDSAFTPSVFSQHSVSAWVARSNQPRVVRDFREEKDWASTNVSMVSELCLPVANTELVGERVLGVVNLESSERAFYTEEDLQYATALCRLSGYVVERVRSRSFLGRLLEVLGDKLGPEELVARSVALIKDLKGYRLLLLVVSDGSRWRVKLWDVPQGYLMGDPTTFVEDLLNGDGSRTQFRLAVAQGKDLYYEPDLGRAEDTAYGIVPGMLKGDERLGSQAVFMLRSGGSVVGALSLDFVITNALSPGQRDMLRHFAAWLGKLMLQEASVERLNDRVRLLDDLQSVADILSKVWHSSDGELYSLRNLVAECLRSEDVADGSDLKRNLQGLQLGIDRVSKIPEQLGPRRRDLQFELVETDPLWAAVREQLGAKAAHLDVRIVTDGVNDRVRADREILRMVLYQLLDNSLDACRDQPVRQITLRTTRVSELETELKVSDTGVGSTSDGLLRMVQLGYTTKPNGIGYGLFWVRQHVAKMEGRFLLYSDGPNTGMHASVLLPGSLR